ncbi:MAG: metal ABC transporter permease, partial [Chloroflexota bacterium]
TAALLTDRLTRMMGIAALVAVGAAVAGLYASFYWSVPSGTAIVLACTLCFGLVWLARTVKRWMGRG